MTEVVQSTPPQVGTGPFAAIRQHFEKHGTIYLIILGAAGLFVAVLVWQNNQGSGIVPVGGGTAGTNPVDTTANQADLNSILAGIEGQSTQLQQIQNTLNTPTTQPTGIQLRVNPGENANTLASNLGISNSVFDALPGVWSAFVSGGGRWNSAKQGGTITIPTSVLPEHTIQTALQPRTATGQ